MIGADKDVPAQGDRAAECLCIKYNTQIHRESLTEGQSRNWQALPGLSQPEHNPSTTPPSQHSPLWNDHFLPEPQIRVEKYI